MANSITKQLLSIPPYLSTAWDNIASLHIKGEPGALRPTLVVQLVDNRVIEVPDLDQAVVDQVFAMHAEVLEVTPSRAQSNDEVLGVPFRVGTGGVENMGAMLQHDSSQSDAPDLPQEILSKIAGISQILGADRADNLPEAEEGCNCFHCQIARAIAGNQAEAEAEEVEEVSDEDLQFRTWDIAQSDQGKDFYTVSNPLDTSEHYTVYLGNPVGCTCGNKDCEHIKAVLKS